MTRPQYRKAIMKDPRFMWPHAATEHWPRLIQDVALAYFVKSFPEDDLAHETRRHLQEMWMTELTKETI